jgi:hypothetical protein
MSAEVRDGLGQVPHGHGFDACERDLGPRLGRADEPPRAVSSCTLGGDQRTGHRPQPPVQGKLADGGVADQAARWDLVRGLEQRERDRKVEAGAFLAKVGRCEVDRDPVPWPVELGRGDSAADPLLRLLAGAVGEAYDRECRSAALEVRFDLDPSRVEPDKSVSDGSGEHLLSL